MIHPTLRLGTFIIGTLVLGACESQECGRENPNYNPDDPTSTACLEGTTGLSIPSTLGSELERDEEPGENRSSESSSTEEDTVQGSEANEESTPVDSWTAMPDTEGSGTRSEETFSEEIEESDSVQGDVPVHDTSIPTDTGTSENQNPEDAGPSEDGSNQDTREERANGSPAMSSCASLWECYLECTEPTGCLSECAGDADPEILNALSDLLFCWEFTCGEQDWETCLSEGCAAEWQACLE